MSYFMEWSVDLGSNMLYPILKAPILPLNGLLGRAKKASDSQNNRVDLDEVGLAAQIMLKLRVDLDVRKLINDLLYSVMDELVEGVQLLVHKALLLDIGTDDRPSVLLGDLFVLIIVHHFIAVLHRLMDSEIDRRS